MRLRHSLALTPDPTPMSVSRPELELTPVAMGPASPSATAEPTAALTVSYRDVEYILPVFTQILMYASPIAYGLTRIPPRFQTIYLLNPLAAPPEAFRASLLGTQWPPARSLAYAAGASIIAFLLGTYNFKRMERKFADVI